MERKKENKKERERENLNNLKRKTKKEINKERKERTPSFNRYAPPHEILALLKVLLQVDD